MPTGIGYDFFPGSKSKDPNTDQGQLRANLEAQQAFFRNPGNPQDLLPFLTARIGGKDHRIARNQLAQATTGLLGEGFRIQQENERRRGEALELMTGAYNRSLAPTLTDDQIDLLYARETDRAAEVLSGDLGFLRDSLGVAGVTGGGFAADLGLQAHQQFARTLAEGKRDLRIAKMQQDSADALRNLQSAFGLGSFIAQGADETGLAVLGEYTGIVASLLGVELGAKAAKEAASAAETGALLGLGGSLAGGAIGLLGG